MTKLTLTVDEAELLRSQHAAAQRGDILLDDIVMPNGKLLCECTRLCRTGPRGVGGIIPDDGIASARSQGNAALIDDRRPVAHAALARYGCIEA
jgi:hypothetical protein